MRWVTVQGFMCTVSVWAVSALAVVLFLETACSVCDSGSGSVSQVGLISVAVTLLSFLHCPALTSSFFGMFTVMVSANCLLRATLPFSTAHCPTQVELWPFKAGTSLMKSLFHLVMCFLSRIWVMLWYLTSFISCFPFQKHVKTLAELWPANWPSTTKRRRSPPFFPLSILSASTALS